jgi:hypothetical protein
MGAAASHTDRRLPYPRRARRGWRRASAETWQWTSKSAKPARKEAPSGLEELDSDCSRTCSSSLRVCVHSKVSGGLTRQTCRPESPIPLGHLCGSDARRTLRPRRHELVSRAEECPKTLWTFRTCLRGEPQAGNWPPEGLTRRVNRSVCEGARLLSAGRTSACVNEADVRPRQVAPNGTPPRPPSRYLHAVRSCAEFIHDLRENSATQHLPLACRQTTCAECLLEGRFPFQAPGPKVGNLSGLRGAPLRMRNVRRVACMDLLVLLAMRVRNGLRDGLRMKRADEECTEDRRGGT